VHSLLIIDDDADTCFSLAELLTLEGYSCVCATGGREGLRLLESKPPDLAIVDSELPDMDGAEFLKTKAEIPSVAAIPVIVVTAHRNVTLLDGAVARLHKPFGIDELLALLRRHLPPANDPDAA
jgi:DNA-binding response OmpR family regulator